MYLFSGLFGTVEKVNKNKAFDAYCEGAEVIINDARYPLDDNSHVRRAIVSKRRVKFADMENIFRFKPYVEEMKMLWNTKRVNFFIIPKKKRFA